MEKMNHKKSCPFCRLDFKQDDCKRVILRSQTADGKGEFKRQTTGGSKSKEKGVKVMKPDNGKDFESREPFGEIGLP